MGTVWETRVIERVGMDVPSKRVLIVEDERDVAELVADVLDFEGYTPKVSSGESAHDVALAFEPDVVLLDLMMPGVDGFEVARQLQTDSRTQNVPIVVMTAMHDAASRAEQIGTPHFLAKPFDMNILIEVVEQATA